MNRQIDVTKIVGKRNEAIIVLAHRYIRWTEFAGVYCAKNDSAIIFFRKRLCCIWKTDYKTDLKKMRYFYAE